MRPALRRRLTLGCAGILFVLAALAVVVPGVGYARTPSSGPEVHLNGGAQQVSLPAGKTYGVYVNDPDNSGYRESCRSLDADGQPIAMRDPWWSMSGSSTENLDFVFNTGSGALTLICSVPGEQVTIRPLPNFRALVAGIALGGVLAAAGLGLILRWGRRRPTDHPTTPSVAAIAAWAEGPHPLP
jgi:hypothetical protein